MAQNQEIPNKKTEVSQWSSRRLFPFAAMSNALAKNFINVFDVLLGFSVLILGLTEIFNHEVSVFSYISTFSLLCASLRERHEMRKVEQASKKNDKK